MLLNCIIFAICINDLYNFKIIYKNAIMNKAFSFGFDHICLPYHKQIPVHSQPTWELSCVITGRGVRLISDNSSRFAERDVVLIPPGVDHCWHFDKEVSDEDGNIENVSIFFETGFLKRIAAEFPELSEISVKISAMNDAHIFCDDTRDGLYDIMVRMCDETPARRLLSLIEMLIYIADDSTAEQIADVRIKDKAKVRILQITSYVNCNYKHSITLDDIVSHVGMNKTAFCQFFKKNYGMTFNKFLLKRRLSIACEMLSGSDMPINEIAIATGIPEPAYFCRVFKNTFGITAKEYRRQQSDIDADHF